MNGEYYVWLDQMDRQVGFQDHGRDARIRILQKLEPAGQRIDGRIRILKKSDPAGQRMDGRIRILKKSDPAGHGKDGRIRILKKADPAGIPSPSRDSFGREMDARIKSCQANNNLEYVEDL